MTKNIDPYFMPFEEDISSDMFPETLNSPFEENPKPSQICLLAVQKLQHYLENQSDWEHNFGLEKNQKGEIIGKMFGVLVVQNSQGEVGYLAAFSGKLAGQNQFQRFVPPVFDTLQEDSFLTKGMNQLTAINLEIKALQTQQNIDVAAIKTLKELRKSNSFALQNKVFDQYSFLNQAGETMTLREIFKHFSSTQPAAGAGECAAPKLFQYAFLHQFKPLAIAEFWWGASPKALLRQHQHFYPACQEKCVPILAFMLREG
jgi:tRNA pseudouridine32 synthase / 23S rRNA pseudouridine746 synthase